MMHKRLFIPGLILVLFSQSQVYAQRGSFKNGQSKQTYSNDSTYNDLYTNKSPKQVIKPARDFLMLTLTYNNWINKPDSVKTKPVNYGFNGYLCYDFPIKKSKLSFATGLGVKVSAMYLNQLQLSNTDTQSVARFISDTAHFKRYKFVTTYLGAPFELRYFSNIENRNRGFKAAIGLQIGTLLGAHTKGVSSISSVLIKEKLDTKRFVSPWDFAATARVGWGNFCLFGSVNLTGVFKQNEGPPITPMSVGISLVGL